MAEMKQPLRRRVARRMLTTVGGGDLVKRIEELEAEVQECRQLNLRVAELVDLVQEVLVPVASQDRERIQAALDKFQQSV